MANGTRLPSRLHHTAYVTHDLEATRQFYEDIIGLPLVASWCEKEELFGAERVYCHCFFGLADGGALAFSQFASPEDQALFGPPMPSSPFHHLALNVDFDTQREIEQRLKTSDNSKNRIYILDHGYCRSLYVTDPNGMIIEFTYDAPGVAAGNESRRLKAHSELSRWLKGDRTSNNTYRVESAKA